MNTNVLYRFITKSEFEKLQTTDVGWKLFDIGLNPSHCNFLIRSDDSFIREQRVIKQDCDPKVLALNYRIRWQRDIIESLVLLDL